MENRTAATGRRPKIEDGQGRARGKYSEISYLSKTIVKRAIMNSGKLLNIKFLMENFTLCHIIGI